MKNIIKFIVIGAIILLLAIFASKALAATTYPDYTNYVNDFAHVLGQPFIDKENAKLLAFDKQTTDQIAIVTIKSLDGQDIESYSIGLADKWKPGQKGKDNGVIFLVATDDRKDRIEIGKGLEGDLTDIQSKHILDDIVKPEFKAGNWESGIEKGTDAIIADISDPSLAQKEATASASSDKPVNGFAIIIIIIVIVVILLIIEAGSSGDDGFGSGIILGGLSGGDSNSGGDGDSGFGGFGGGGFSGGGASGSF